MSLIVGYYLLGESKHKFTGLADNTDYNPALVTVAILRGTLDLSEFGMPKYNS